MPYFDFDPVRIRLFQQIEEEEEELRKARQLLKFPTSLEILGATLLPGSYPAEVGFLADMTIPKLELIAREATRVGFIEAVQRSQRLKEEVQSFLDNLPQIFVEP